MAMKVGIQLYSVRDEMKKDPISAIRQVAEIGYKNLEFASSSADTDPGVGFGGGLLLVAVIRTDLLGLTGLPAAGWIDMTRPFGQPLLAVTGLMACAAAVAFSGRLSEARMAAAAVCPD